MPTAVERLLDAFLKFDGPREQGALNDAFVKIDDTIINLAGANSELEYLKIKLESDLQGEFNVIGGSFLKLGSDFHKISIAGELIDQFVQKVTPTVGSVNGGGPQADFVVLDHKINTTSEDLKILGVDFLKIHTATSPESFTHKITNVSTDFLKLNGDMAADRDAFLKLGADFLKLGGNSDSNSSPLDNAYKEFGGDLQTIGGQFDLLANDFLKLSQEVLADGSVRIGDVNGGDNAAGGGGGAGKVGATLALLYQDFFALEASLNTIGGAASQLIGLLSHEHKHAPDDSSSLVGDVTIHGGGHG